MGLFNKKQTTEGFDTASLVNNFISKSEGLTRILEKETEYLKDKKAKQAEMLAETKGALIEELEAIKASLTKSPEVLKDLPSSEKERLKAANLTLIKVAEENYRETSKAQEVNRLILEAISYAVNQSKVVEGAYGDKGTTYKNDTASNPVSLITNA